VTQRDPRANVPSDRLEEPDRIVKAADPEGMLGTTARYWITRHLPELARVHFRDGARILDLGCGDGPNAALLARAGLSGTYLGVDVAPSPLWPERAGRVGSLTIDFTVGDAHRIDDLDREFDALVSVSAFEHFADDHRVFIALGRRMTPGSRGVIIVPSPLGHLVWGFRHGYRKYTPSRMMKALEGTPFSLVEAIPAGGIASAAVFSLWRGAALTTAYGMLAALIARSGGNRAAAKRRYPWAPHLPGIVQFAHLRTERGRQIHRRANRALLRADERFGGPPSQWAFVIERKA
jgi:SAM-dependent methyltransferase